CVQKARRDRSAPKAAPTYLKHLAVTLLYSLRTLLPPEERKLLASSPAINPEETVWVQDAQRVYAYVHAGQKEATREQREMALISICNVASKLRGIGYGQWHAALSKFVS